MRLILYSYEYPPLGGGVGNTVKNILFEFSKYPDLHIDFITSSIDEKLSIKQVYPNIIFHRLKMRRRCKEEYHKQTSKDMLLFSLKAYFYTWKLVLKKKYDFNHFWGFPGGLIPLLFRWRMKYVVSLLGVDVPSANSKYKKWYVLYKPITWLIWKCATKTIANSYDLASLANKTSRDLDIKVIPNGVDVDKIKPSSEAKKYKKFTVTAGGTSLRSIKSLDFLIMAFAKLNREFSNTVLKLLGNGEDGENLRKLAKELRIEKSVKFLGYRSHDWIEKNLGKFHVLCLPSINEGMSNAVLEGMAAGLPIVVTDTGGASEFIKGNGYLVKKKDSEQIYRCLKKFYTNRNRRVEMGKRSREIAEKMSWNEVAESYYKIYKEIF